MPTDQFLNVEHGTIFARRWAPATSVKRKAPLILLHDSLGSVELWRDFPATLAQQLARPVIAYDRLGFGHSSPRTDLPGTKFIEEEATLHLPALLRELEIGEFALFGHSVGGGMALTAAAHAAAACKAVITEAAQAFVEPRTVTGIERAKVLFQQAEQFDRLAKWHGSKAAWVLNAWTETWLSPEFATWSLEQVLPSVECPILVIHGDQDEYGSVAFPEFIRDHVAGPVEMHVLRGCGHVPHREQPERVLDLVTQFGSKTLS